MSTDSQNPRALARGAVKKEVMQACGIDGGELQDIALAHGLLRSAEPPPDWDGCNFYERTELIK